VKLKVKLASMLTLLLAAFAVDISFSQEMAASRLEKGRRTPGRRQLRPVMEERAGAWAGGSSVMLWRDTEEGRRCGAREGWRRGGGAALGRNRGGAAAGARDSGGTEGRQPAASARD
jgi:hypothetical protein